VSTLFKSLPATLGFLRLGLLGLALVDLILPLSYALLRWPADTSASFSGWAVLPTVIAPVMAPLLLVVILFDAIMSRVRVADGEGETRARYLLIYRIELASIAIMLAYWVPYLARL